MATPVRVTLVRPRHVVWGVLWMSLLVAGGLLQIHLRFCERDMEIKTRQAQEEMSSLADKKAALQAGVEALRSGDKVRERAIAELGLKPASPTQVHRLDIPDDLWAKYAVGGASGTATASAGQPGAPEPAWMEWIDRNVNVADLSADPARNR